MTGPADPEARFAALVDGLLGTAGVTPPTGGAGFGANAVKVDGRIFAMLVGGELVVKLPKARVEELVRAGDGGPFDAGKGRPMKEWMSVAPDRDWPALAREALAFVSGRRR